MPGQVCATHQKSTHHQNSSHPPPFSPSWKEPQFTANFDGNKRQPYSKNRAFTPYQRRYYWYAYWGAKIPLKLQGSCGCRDARSGIKFITSLNATPTNHGPDQAVQGAYTERDERRILRPDRREPKIRWRCLKLTTDIDISLRTFKRLLKRLHVGNGYQRSVLHLQKNTLLLGLHGH